MEIRAFIVISIAVLLILVACDGSGEADPTSTALVATERPTPVSDVPGRPDAFEDYAGIVGIYLTVNEDAVLGEPCLSDLMTTWAMAEPEVPLLPEERCLVGNTDDDEDQEVVVLFTAEPAADDGFGLLSNVVVYDKQDDAYVAVFESAAPDALAEVFPQAIVAAQDITGDGVGELVYTDTTCGANTCTLTVNVFTGSDGAYERLPPDGGLFMSTANVTLEAGAGEGEKLIVLNGGTAGSVGAGPQRERTEVYGWDGDAFTLLETTFEPSDLLYFAILDADTVFNSGALGIAAQMYAAVLEDDSLVESGHFEKENEREELSAYALFRAGLAQVVTGDEEGGLETMQRALDDYGDTLNARLADSFIAAYDATGEIGAACLAVQDRIEASISATADPFQLFWDFGFANPPFVPEDVCPL